MVTKYLYRIPLPLSVEEYQIAQLYTVAEFSKQETGGNNGIEVVTNEPFSREKHPPESQLLDGSYTEGQYTLKNYHLQDKVPKVFKYTLSADYLTIEEKAWNSYPFCRTVLRNKGFAPTSFQIVIESFHHTDINLKNPHNLSDDELKNLTNVTIDIGDNDHAKTLGAFDLEFDTNIFKTPDVGPLQPRWYETFDPSKMMCCYKLVSLTLNVWGSSTVGSYIFPFEEKLFTDFHRRLYCYMDKWKGMSMVDIRKYEEITKKELEQLIKGESLRGITS